MFVIMLDDLLEVHSEHWAITAENASLPDLRLTRQHDGGARIIPRSTAAMRLIENKSLINATSGRLDRGGIYEAEPK